MAKKIVNTANHIFLFCQHPLAKLTTKIKRFSIKKNNRKALYAFLCVIFITSSVLGYFLFKTTPAQAAWWPGNSGGSTWTKRQQLPLINNSGNDLAVNTPVSVTINTKKLFDLGLLQSDCDDLRIVYQTNDTTFKELNRYLVYPGNTTCATSEATRVYFPLQSTLSSSYIYTYYMYYNNTQATTPSNSDNAFDIGSADALLVCPFNGTTTCAAGETNTAATPGAIRYSGSKSALSFDGSGSYINTADHFATSLSNTSTATFEYWYKETFDSDHTQIYTPLTAYFDVDTSDRQFRISHRNDTGDRQQLQVFIATTDSDNANYAISNEYVLPSDTWTHVAIVYNGNAAASSRITAYINGIAATMTVTGTIPTTLNNSNAHLTIGGIANSTGMQADPFYGLMDEVRISNISRYTSNFTPQTSPFIRDDYTKLLYHFDENGRTPAGNYTLDDSGNNNTGTITSATYTSGLIGVNNSTNDTGIVSGDNSYAGIEAAMIEEDTTNLVTNPSFEHSTFNTNWNTDSCATITPNSSNPYYKFGTHSVKIEETSCSYTDYYTTISTTLGNLYTFSAYIYNATSGSVGGNVDTSVVNFIFDGTSQIPTFTSVGNGWWRLTYTQEIYGGGSRNWGIRVTDAHTVYLDGVQLEEKNHVTSYADGSLDDPETSYSWSGDEHQSTSTRAAGKISYENPINTSAGTISFWVKSNPNYNIWSVTGGGTNQYGHVDMNAGWSCKGITIYQNWGALNAALFTSGCSGITLSTNSTSYNINNWYHITITYNNTASVLYVNGSAVDSDSGALLSDLGYDINIGSLSGGDGNIYTRYGASYSDFRIYNSALTSTQVEDIYYSGFTSHSDTYSIDAFSESKGQNPIAIYHFAEGYGTTAADASPYGHNLTTSGAAWNTTGNYSLYFDGSNDYAYRPADRDFNPSTTSFTISGLFKHNSTPPTVGNTHTLLSRYGSAGYKIYMNSSGYLCFGVDSDSTWTPEHFACSTISLADSKWHTFSAVRTNTPSLLLYVDGLPIGSDTDLTTLSLNTASSLYIGIDSNGTSNPWPGNIDELYFYPYARSDNQVKTDLYTPQTIAILGTSDQNALTNGLIGYWKLDETTGTTATDSSGNNNTGTLYSMQETGTAQTGGSTTTLIGQSDLATTDDAYNNAVIEITGGSCGITTGTNKVITDYIGSSRTITVGSAWSVSPDTCTYLIDHQAMGNFGNGVRFDGSNDYISVADSNSLDITGPLTINLWVRPNGTSVDWARFVDKIYNTSYYFGIGRGSGRDLSVWMANTEVVDTDEVLTDNIWQMATAVYDGKLVTIYLNGTAVASNTFTGTLSANTSPLYIGRYSGEAFNGFLDDIRLYNRALSSDEVQKLYKWAPGPFAYWRLDEGQGDKAYDSSGSGITGTLLNTTTTLWQLGKFNTGLTTGSSSTDRVALSNSSSVKSLTSFTTEAWVYPTSSGTSGRGRYFYAENTSNSASIGRNCVGVMNNTSSCGAGVFGAYFRTSNEAASVVLCDPTTFSLNQWYHIAAVFNADTDIHKLYVNGVLVRTSTTAASPMESNNPLSTPALGNWVSGGGYNFPGIFDEVKLYSYERTSQQIIEDMNANHPAPGSPIGSAIADWNFEEGYGDTLHNLGSAGSLTDGDLAGSGTTCPTASSACPTWTNNGKVGKALDFDGVDDYIDAGSNTAIDDVFAQGGTVSAWIKIDSFGESSYGRVFDKGSGANNYTSMYVCNGGLCTNTLAFYRRSTGDGNGGSWRAPANSISTGEWIHIAVSFDDRSVNNDPIFYINGQPQTALESTAPVTSFVSDASNNLWIGNRNNVGGDRTFDGLIDDLRIYRSVLTADQIKEVYNQGSAVVMGSNTNASGTPGDNSATRSYCVPGNTTDTCNPPVAEWNLDEKTGTNSYDTSGNNHTLNLNNTTWQTGKQGNSIYFNNSASSYGSNSDTISSINTIQFWLYPNQTNNVLLMLNGACDTGDRCIFDQGNSIQITNGIPSPTVYINGRTSTSLVQNQWQMITVTTATELTSSSLLVGAYPGTEAPLLGAIDQIKFYDYVRTPAQIAWDYNHGAPLAWFQLDECAGNTAYNAALNGNGTATGINGTIYPNTGRTTGNCNSGTNTEMWNNGTSGKYYASLDFDGAGDYVDIAASTTLDNIFANPGGGTISAWVKPDSFGEGGYGRIVDKNNTSMGLFVCQSGNCNNNSFELMRETNTSGRWSTPANSVTPGDGKWYHIVVTYDNNYIHDPIFYINGELVATTENTTPSGAFWSDASGHMIIGRNSNGDRTFDGQIDDIQFFNYTLTAQQVKTLYNNGAVSYK